MNSFAHSLSQPIARREAAPDARADSMNTVVILLVAAIAALLVAGALVYSSMSNEIESLQATHVAAQQQSVQNSAMEACIANHKSSTAVVSNCRNAAAIFAANNPQSGQFDQAVAYIYPR